MKVRLKTKWFAPTAVVVRDELTHLSGRRFPKGVVDIPEEFRKHLPKSAIILDKSVKEEMAKSSEPETLAEVDLDRQAADALNRATEEGDKSLKEIRQMRMAKAREAKKRKAEGK